MRQHRLRRFGRDEKAAALVEFGLVLPFLMIIMCAIIDFGLALYTLHNLTTAVREGARFAAVQESVSAGDAAVKARVNQYIQSVGKADDTLSHADISVAIETASGITNIVVGVPNYTYNPVTPLAPLFGMGTVTFSRSATFRWERSN